MKQIPTLCAVLVTSLSLQVAAAELPAEAQRMLDDLGTTSKMQKKNNNKTRRCIYGGTKKIVVIKRKDTTVLSGDYNNCKEPGSTRDGCFEVTVKNGEIVSRSSKRSINSELHEAVNHGDVTKAKALIGSGADVNFTEKIEVADFGWIEGWTPLMSAVNNGNVEMVKLLVNSGAWVNYLNSTVGNALLLAAGNGNSEIVSFLIAKGAYLNNRNMNDITPLMASTINGHATAAKTLIDAKAELNYINRSGDSAIVLALVNNRTDIAELLIEAGSDVNIRNRSGETALMIATAENNEPMVRTLIKLGADLKVRADSGKSAIEIAAANGNKNIVKMLDPDFTSPVIPSPPPKAEVKTAQTTAVEAEIQPTEQIPHFEIRHYVLEGNTLLPADKIEQILAKHTGKERNFGDIQQAMEELEAAYRHRGYTMVTVILPEQELTRGEVRLQAIEPRITEIKIDGNRHFSRENILTSLPTLETGAIPRVNAISENLRAANENPARKMTLQFKAQDNPEELHAELQVTDQKPWKATLSGDNTGNSATGRYRTGLGFQYFNLFNRDHVAALQYTTSPDHIDKVNILSGSYRLPIYKLGDTLDVFGAYSNVDSGTTQVSGTDLKVSGKGIVSGFRYNMGLPRSGDYEQKLIGGIDYRLYDNSALVLGADLAKDVVAHPLSLTYGGVWTTDLLVVDGSLGLLYNTPWGGQGKTADFAEVRNGAVADYLIVRCGLNFMARPGADWMIRVATSGQYTRDRLIPGEQFGYGGSNVLRGYQEREESWDTGFSGSFELYSPDLAGLVKLPASQLRLLGFFDGGVGYNLRPQPGELGGNSLRSAGAGLRYGSGETFSISLDWGYALDDSNQTRRGGSAIHFKGQLSY